MNSGAFIGGVLVGVLGLAAAACIDNRITEAKFSPDLKKPENLDETRLIQELNNYFFKAQEIYGRCNEIMLSASELISTPVELPWDSPLQKAMNSLGGKMTEWSRAGKAEQLLNLREETEKLFNRYLGIFERANALLAARGLSPLLLKGNILPCLVQKPDNSLDNDNWDLELGELADSITNSIEQSCALAEELIDRLEGDAPPSATKPMLLRET